MFRLRASQKLIKQNIKSASRGLCETSLNNIAWSPRAEERAVAASGFIGLADETAVLSLGFITVAEAAMDFPFGFTDAEESTVFSLVLRSVEIEYLPVCSIAMNVREKIINFDGNIS